MPPRPRFDRRAPVRELPNINDRINYPQLRVVDSDGAQLGVISREEALDVARDRELDLVLVSEKADPPVCRIMDYGKFKFEQEKKAKEAKKKSHQTEVKEVKMRYKIDQHDYDVRIGQAQRFLKAGDKVKCTVIFRGREIQHTALAETLLRRMAKDLEEKAEIQQAPKREGRNMIMFLTPRKTPLVKKEEKEQASMIVFNDHEEVGSVSTTGADGPFLDDVIRRVCYSSNDCNVEVVKAKSFVLSCDNAHAVHPNFVHKHDPQHKPQLNGGIVIKYNTKQRYTTDGYSAALFKDLCARINVPIQSFVSRNDMPCGSTIGPLTAGRVGIRGIDIGICQLAMHSCREIIGSKDPLLLRNALSAFLGEEL